MDNVTPLSLSAAAWFFVGQSEDTGESSNVSIKSPFTIGRNPDSDLVLQSRSVSGSHARIVSEEGGLWLYDLSSTNGTFINGDRVVDRVLLKDGDTVQFAAVVFQATQSSNSSDIRTAEDAHNDALVTMQRLQMERLLTGGVVPFFQPIMNICGDQSEVAGFEVLGRSRLFGLRTPAQMFEAASRLEMEAELSRVLRRQGIELAQDNLPEHYTLYVNTHPAELQYPGLIKSLREIRDLCPKRKLSIEVSESVLNDTSRIIELRQALTEMDIQLAFDNFGAGQSRLFALSEVTPDVIKFDLKLIKDIDKAPKRRQHFVGALVNMLIDLGITPLAECVEDGKEHETLKQLGFQLAQGFYYAKPCSLPDSVRWLNGDRDEPQGGETPSAEGPLIEAFMKNPAKSAPTGHVHCSAKDADWLLDQSANSYTIQVLSATTQARAEDYVNKHDQAKEFAIFAKKGKTRLLYIVVYGVFADRDAAKAATTTLSSAGVSPWIRMMSGVHAEIRRTPIG